MTRKRVDANQSAIFKIFRQMGCTVLNLSNVGGCADALVAITPIRQPLVELKDGSKPPSQRKLTPAEAKFHSKWKGELYIINNEDEAIALVNRIRRECDDFTMLQ